jgi:glycosyltransferase involved in cell wall biosynthesis
MIKILYCTDYLSAGGVESQTTALVTGLDQSRFEPHVMCFYGECAERSLQFVPDIRAAGIPLNILDLTFDRRSKVRGVTEIIRQTWRLRPQIFHAVNYHGNLLGSLARPFLPPQTRFVGASYTETTPKQLLYQRLSWWLTAAIVVNSPHLVEQLHRDARIPLRKIVHIPNGLYVERFQNNPNPSFREQIAPDAEVVLMMLTRIVPRKASHLLAEALGILKSRQQLPEKLRAFIVGESTDSTAQKQLDDAVNQHGLHDVVTQYPQTNNVIPYYHAADISVLVSLSGEGLPNVVLESLAAGRPMIISEAANRTKVIEDNVTGWIVRNNDPEHLADTLHHIFAMPQNELLRMRDACRLRAGEYSMDKMINKHQDLYERVLGG